MSRKQGTAAEPLVALLDRARTGGRVRRVDEHDVALLEAELGRPLPPVLRAVWKAYGAGPLGHAHLSPPREVSGGLTLAERHLDHGQLPVGLWPDGEALLIELNESSDPIAWVYLSFPKPHRAAVGPLSVAVEVAGLLAVQQQASADERPAIEKQLHALDPDRRYREPGAWAERGTP